MTTLGWLRNALIWINAPNAEYDPARQYHRLRKDFDHEAAAQPHPLPTK